MELTSKMISYATAAFSVLGIGYGGATFTHDKLQQIDQMEENILLVDMRLDAKILTDRHYDLRKRMDDIESRYGEDLFDAPGPVRDSYKTMKQELDSVDRELGQVQQEFRRKGSGSNRYYERKMDGIEGGRP